MLRPMHRMAASACLFLSGLLALIFELCWVRKAALAFGVTLPALSTVLAVFFGGLALGSYAFGRYSRRAARPLRTWGHLEIGIGALALLSPFAFQAADAAYGALYASVLPAPGLRWLLRFGLLAMVLLPPTVLMGGTVPLACRQFVDDKSVLSRSVARLYVLNTLGAVVGCLLAGLVLIRHVGIDLSLQLGGALCIAVGLALRALRVDPPPLAVTDAPRDAPRSSPLWHGRLPTRQSAVAGLFFGVGFVALAHEVVWTRYLALLVPHTVYSTTLIIAVTLVGIALGTILTARMADRWDQRALAFGAAAVGSSLVVLITLLLPASVLTGWLGTRAPVTKALLSTLLLLPAATLSGAAFPLAVRMVVAEPEQAGPGVGRLLALNTLGGIAGALVAGFYLLPRHGLQTTLMVTTGVGLSIGLVAWLVLAPRVARSKRAVACLAAVTCWLVIPMATGTRLPADFLASSGKLVDFREGYGSNLVVVRKGDVLELEIDGLWQGASHKTQQVTAAHLPMLLHPNPESVLVIGLGTGQTASRFLHYPIKRLHCVELEAELVSLVKKHFESAWMRDSRVRIFIEDGRTYVAHARATYDIISVELGQAFRPGVASVYSAEFYEEARRRLNPGGVVVQFVPVTFFTPSEFRTLIATFLKVFPRSTLWYNRSELLLIGTTGPKLKLTASRLALLQSRPAVRKDLSFAFWGGPAHHLNRPDVVASAFLVGPGLSRLSAGARIYHDDRPWLEYTTVRSAGNPGRIGHLILSHLDPVETVLAEPRGQAFAKRTQKNRRHNLGDILAYVVKGGVASLRKAGRTKAAMKRLSLALQANPYDVDTLLQIASLLVAQKQAAAAVQHYHRALHIDPTRADAYDELGRIFARLGRFPEALSYHREALLLQPDHRRALRHFLRVLQLRSARSELLAKQRIPSPYANRVTTVIHRVGQLLRLGPSFSGAYLELAVSIAEAGYSQQSVIFRARARQLQIPKAKLHHGLARALGKAGQLDEALMHHRHAVRLAPRWGAAGLALAWALATHPDPVLRSGSEAVRRARMAAGDRPKDDPLALDTLAAAHAASGAFARAVTKAEAAVVAAEAAGALSLAAQIRSRLASYRSQRPHLERVLSDRRAK